MSVSAQYVGFKAKEIAREYFPGSGLIDRALRDHLYDSERSIHIAPFELPECPGHLLS
jgi:hypothetical protein